MGGCVRNMIDDEWNGDIFSDGERGQQMKGLEDKPNILCAKIQHALLRHGAVIIAQHIACSAIIAENACDDRNKRGFAAA